MRTMTKSLIGKATLGLGIVLTLCFAVLLFASSWLMRSSELEQFEVNALTLTQYFGEQVNTGTRLKRDTMVAPTVNGALENPGLDIVAIRLVNVDGTEVIASRADTAPSDILSGVGNPDFDAAASVRWSMPYLEVRAPVALGVGADRAIVGEIVAVWRDRKSVV